MAGISDEQRDAVLAAARVVGLPLAPADVDAVTAHLTLLRGFARIVGDPGPEPASVFQP